MPVRKTKKVAAPEPEPIYEYIKGKGWCLSLVEWATREIAGYKLTAIRRKPEAGEYYVSGRSHTPAVLLEEFSNDEYWVNGLKSGPSEWAYYFSKAHSADRAYFRKSSDKRFITLLIEAPRGPE